MKLLNPLSILNPNITYLCRNQNIFNERESNQNEPSFIKIKSLNFYLFFFSHNL